MKSSHFFLLPLFLLFFSITANALAPTTGFDINNFWQPSDANIHLICVPSNNGCSGDWNGFVFLGGRSGQFAVYNTSDGTASNLSSFLSPNWDYNSTLKRHVSALGVDNNYHVLLVGGGTSGQLSTYGPERGLFHSDLNQFNDWNANDILNGWELLAQSFDGNQALNFGGTKTSLYSTNSPGMTASNP